MIYSLIKIGAIVFLLTNTIGFFKHYTNNFWTKNKTPKELTINGCDYVFKQVNDIKHFVQATKIKTTDHLQCNKRVNIFLLGLRDFTVSHGNQPY